MTPFTATTCECCGQTTDYLVSLDGGSSKIVLAIYNAVRIKGENRVHLRNDMECTEGEFADHMTMALNGRMTSKMIDNVLRPKYHGLVAQVERGGQGEYLITPKGARFLRNEPVIRSAVIDKRTHTKKHYYDEKDLVTFRELLSGEHWMWKLDYGWTLRIAPEESDLTPTLL